MWGDPVYLHLVAQLGNFKTNTADERLKLDLFVIIVAISHDSMVTTRHFQAFIWPSGF